MSGGNSSNDGNRNSDGSGEDEGWGSQFVKVASAAAAAVTVAGGLYALLTSSASGNSQPEVAFGARRMHDNKGDVDDPRSLPQGTPSSQVGWTKPEFGWVKLNVDGSRVHGVSAGCGGVLRDASGTWLRGFAQKLGPSCQPHETELEGILKGLQLASDMNVEKLIVESDSESAVSMVEKGLGCKYHHPQFDIVRRIRQLRFDPKWQVRVVLISRTANGVANRLARDARDLPSNYLHTFHFVPDNCSRLLSEDEQRVSF